jgi:hypothetical protein
MSIRFAGSATAVVALCASAHASVITTNNQALWNWRVTNGGQVVGTENFNDVADGFYSGAITDTLGNVTWTASATNGLYVDTGWLSTNYSSEPLVFNFNPGVRAVAGNIFGTDLNFNVVTCVVSVTLANGFTYEGISSSMSDFVGFYSTSADISTMTILTSPLATGEVFATIDNLYLAVPAPGAAALIGLAGLVARRRRA